MKKMKLNGAIFSGGGNGKKFLELPWVKQQIREKLGFTPYPGTLNVKLNEKSGMTSIPGVFAAGNVRTNARPVVDAIASGKKAAEEIDNYLK